MKGCHAQYRVSDESNIWPMRSVSFLGINSIIAAAHLENVDRNYEATFPSRMIRRRGLEWADKSVNVWFRNVFVWNIPAPTMTSIALILWLHSWERIALNEKKVGHLHEDVDDDWVRTRDSISDGDNNLAPTFAFSYSVTVTRSNKQSGHLELWYLYPRILVTFLFTDKAFSCIIGYSRWRR